MDTGKLIDNLAKDLQPVRPLSAPVIRAVIMSFTALVLVTGMISLLGGPRADWLTVLQSPIFMSGNILMLVAGFMSAVAAFSLSVPDTKIRRPVIALLCTATIIWAGICLYAAVSVTAVSFHAEITDIGASA